MERQRNPTEKELLSNRRVGTGATQLGLVEVYRCASDLLNVALFLINSWLFLVLEKKRQMLAKNVYVL